MNIEELSKHATDRQKEILIAIQSEGTESKAAMKLGLNTSTVNKAHMAVKSKAAMQGWSPAHDMTHPAPDGFKLKGTSTLYDMETGAAKIQWVKTSADQARQDEIFKEALAALAEALPKEKPTPAPTITDDNLATCYPVGDHHFGMLSWHEETGENYDISIGKRLLKGSIDYLVTSSPASKFALVALLGDFLHYDSWQPVTPSHRHLLDADGRFPQMVRAAIKAVRYMIRAALTKHEHVHVIVEIGNHDTSSSIFLMECLHNIYEDEPRITIDRSPSHFHYWRFGKVLIGTHHGDKVKSEKLPMIMATDRPIDWGETEYRYWMTGHIHHDSVKEISGVRCESFRILAPLDAYAANAGYRSGRDMKAIVFHKEYGEVGRHTVNPKMLEEVK